MDCSPPGSSVHGTLQARILDLGSHSLFQGIFWAQGLNPGLLHCRQILYCLTLRGRERIPGVPVESQEEALSTGKARGTPWSCNHSQSPPDDSVHSPLASLQLTNISQKEVHTFLWSPRFCSFTTGTPQDQLVWRLARFTLQSHKTVYISLKIFLTCAHSCIYLFTHSSILAWRSPWTEQPGRLPSIGWQSAGRD